MKINRRNSPLFAAGQAKWDAFVAGYSGPYDLSPAVYAGMNNKVEFICPAHGRVTMDAKGLMAGRKCYQCSIVARGQPRFTQRKVLARFMAVHGDRYDYSNVVYKGQNVPVEIRCAKHGPFLQQPEFHWAGSGCPECFNKERRGASQKDTLESLIDKVRTKFGGIFDLSGVVYTGSQDAITILCTKHMELCTTRPNWLTNGYNPCPKCNHMKSAGESQVLQFLSIFAKTEARNRALIKPKELDIVLPELNLAVEYCGEFHHSHFDVADERKNKHRHFDKYLQCKAQGLRLLTVYESEWKDRQHAIKRLLRNAIGKSKGRLMARKCELRSVATTEAKAFYEKYHPQGGAGGGEHYGLYWAGKLVACMRFTYGVNDRGAGAATRVWTLSRYATRVTVAGAASRLFKAFIAEHKPEAVKSFSDNRYFSGGMYAQLGFTLEEEVAPDYLVWSPKRGLLPKPHYQRRQIPKRLIEHGVVDTFDPDTDSRSERDMTYLMKCGRIYDCGKKRWVWKPIDTPPNT